MGAPLDGVESFRESLERCLADATFTDRFYARFILSHEEVARLFAKVDLRRQASVLRASLYLVLRAAMGHDDGTLHLESVARTHAHKGHDIGPHLYQHWIDCLIEAARETDPRFAAPVEAEWRLALGRCVEIILANYGR